MRSLEMISVCNLVMGDELCGDGGIFSQYPCDCGDTDSFSRFMSTLWLFYSGDTRVGHHHSATSIMTKGILFACYVTHPAPPLLRSYPLRLEDGGD